MTSAGERGGDAPLVTVVVPCGPGIEAVELALRSIRAQTIRSVEIVAVNLGCPDNYFTALTGPAGGERIQAVDTGESIAAAWNLAAARSSARYICFLLPGDVIEETFLEKCLFHLEVASLDVCGSWRVRGAGIDRAGPFSLRVLLERNASVPAVIRRETLIRAGGFDSAAAPAVLLWDLWIRMAEHGARGRVLPEPLIRNSSEPVENASGSAFAAQKYGYLLNCPGLVDRLDAARAVKPPLGSYAGLLETAPPASSPAVVVAMPYLTMGGAERAMAGLLGELTRRGFRVFLVSTEVAPQGLGDSTDWFRGNVAGLYRLPQFLAPGMRLAFFSYLIQQHSIQVLLQVGSASVYEWLPRLKNLFAELAVADLLFNPVGHVDSCRRSGELIDHIVVEHEGMADWLGKLGEPRERISVIPNAVDLSRFAPRPPRDWRTGETRREDGFVAGFFGRLSEEKAPDTFVRIAARFQHRPSFHFLICGTGPLETSLRALSRQLGLEDTVHFLGFVDTREYLPSCHVTVTCSRLDGRPNIVLESLAMGVPVVASNVGGIPEMAPEGHGSRLFEPDDVAGFAGAIERLASDREAYLRLAEAGRRWVASQHSLARAAGDYAKLFHTLAEARTRPARSAEDLGAIATAVLPVPRRPRTLPKGRLGASLSIVREAFSRSNLSCTLRTVWQYARLRRDSLATRDLAGLFDAGHYALQRPDVEFAAISPLWHYLLMGFREGVNPSPRFDTDYYLGAYSDVAGAGVNPLLHYIEWGRTEGRTCLPPWDWD